MKITPQDPPRKFQAGYEIKREIRDCGRIGLEAGEQVTFTTEAGGEYDVVRKDFGFYATPSMNGRLAKFGFRTAWVRNRDGRDFILLVENGSEAKFREYLAQERAGVVKWMDGQSPVDEPACPICSGGMKVRFHYDAPPPGETRFGFSKDGAYARDVWVCRTCSHFVSRHRMQEGSLYEGDYVRSTYGGREGLQKTFDRVMSLPPEKSDNVQRVARIIAFLRSRGRAIERANLVQVLDVGSGTGVFAARANAEGLACTALDPDPIAAEHLREVVKTKTILGDFLKTSVEGRFELLTLNKVLEHVEDPRALLRAAHAAIRPGGWIYVEVPDGEMAQAEGPGREEFFIDHPHVFSLQSAVRVMESCGFRVLEAERLREPSTKFTVRLFGEAIAAETKDR